MIVGKDCTIQQGVTLDVRYSDGCGESILGDRAVVRSGTVVYADVEIGDDFRSGHCAIIREKTRIGHTVVVGSNTVIEGHVEIGNFVKIESNVFIPTHTSIGNHVFIGPGAVLANDKYPQRLRDEYEPEGPVLEDSVTVGANATILPGVRIGEGSIVGAGSVVTRDVPPWSMAVGVPAVSRPLPDRLRHRNRAKAR